MAKKRGRPSKAEEAGLKALLDECWTDADRRATIRKLAAQAKTGNMKAIELLLAYTFGRPKERIEHSGDQESPIIVKGYITVSPDDWSQADSDIQPAALADQPVEGQEPGAPADG